MRKFLAPTAMFCAIFFGVLLPSNVGANATHSPSTQDQKDSGDWVGPLGPHSGNVFAH